jgi:hypothetical protein
MLDFRNMGVSVENKLDHHLTKPIENENQLNVEIENEVQTMYSFEDDLSSSQKDTNQGQLSLREKEKFLMWLLINACLGIEALISSHINQRRLGTAVTACACCLVLLVKAIRLMQRLFYIFCYSPSKSNWKIFFNFLTLFAVIYLLNK